MTVQARSFRWTQQGGKGSLQRTGDVVVSPPAVRLPPGATQIIRVVRTSKAPVRGEEAYRIIINEVPDQALRRGGAVNFATELRIPVFFSGRGTSNPAVAWSLRNAGNATYLVAQNQRLAATLETSGKRGRTSIVKKSRYRPLWITLASVALMHLPCSASADEAEFSETANRACRQIIDTRPDQVIGKGRTASAEVVAASLKRTELSDDLRRALYDDIAASRDEFSRSFRALAKLVPPAERQEDQDIFMAFLEGEVALQTNRLQWLENRTSTLIPASEFGPATELVNEAMQRLGFAGRDCQLIAQDVDIPDDRRIFVRKAAAACTEIVVRRSEQDHEGNRDIVLAGLVDAHRGTLELPRPELDAALKAAEAEWQTSFQQLSDIPAQLAPDGESWTRFLRLFQQMAEVQRSRLLVLHSADEDPSAAYKAVRSPIMDVELSALGLENTDCRSIHF